MQKLTTEEVIKNFRKVHGDRYDYSKLDYISSHDKVKIICKIHGEFEQVATTHGVGRGCYHCGRLVTLAAKKVTTEQFIENCIKVHGDRYSYKNTVYTKAKDPVTVHCYEHGDFKITAQHHSTGSGCSLCARGGFSKIKSGTFYILNAGDITKVGITNLDITVRIRDLTTRNGFSFEVLRTYSFDSGFKCAEMETNILRYLRGKYKNPVNKFSGSSECFLGVDFSWLFEIVDIEAKKLLNK